MTWPPELPALKDDLGVADERDDDRLRRVLDAAVALVERVHDGALHFGPQIETSPLPTPGPDMELGTVRLAGRWHTRRRSPDGLVSMGELGVARVGSGDADIDRMLRIGRYRSSVFA